MVLVSRSSTQHLDTSGVLPSHGLIEARYAAFHEGTVQRKPRTSSPALPHRKTEPLHSSLPITFFILSSPSSYKSFIISIRPVVAVHGRTGGGLCRARKNRGGVAHGIRCSRILAQIRGMRTTVLLIVLWGLDNLFSQDAATGRNDGEHDMRLEAMQHTARPAHKVTWRRASGTHPHSCSIGGRDRAWRRRETEGIHNVTLWPT